MLKAVSDRTDIRRLAEAISACCSGDGRFEQCVPGVFAIRVSRAYPEPVHAMQQPALCLVAQGAKSVMLGQEVVEYKASRMTIYSVDVPVSGQVTLASASEPYLCFMLYLDSQKVAELALKVFPQGLTQPRENGAVYASQADDHIINAAARLLELSSQPNDATLIAPLIIDEILIRLLKSPIGTRVAQIGLTQSKLYNVAKAIAWLRSHFVDTMKIEQLAALTHMSVSSFHQHFKSVTSMSPLQYQKALRLQEARRLMLSTKMDIGSVSDRVGYASVSQFSREYARFFGTAPTKDVARLTQEGVADRSELEPRSA
jgi:AraC-like DNA-binding protein